MGTSEQQRKAARSMRNRWRKAARRDEDRRKAMRYRQRLVGDQLTTGRQERPSERRRRKRHEARARTAYGGDKRLLLLFRPTAAKPRGPRP
jgi:hypothetical protein